MRLHRRSQLVKMDILLNGDAKVDALNFIVHRVAYEIGKLIVDKQKIIPRQQFSAYQAAIGQKIVARYRYQSPS